jgi:enterochelin esterase family protein
MAIANQTRPAGVAIMNMNARRSRGRIHSSPLRGALPFALAAMLVVPAAHAQPGPARPAVARARRFLGMGRVEERFFESRAYGRLRRLWVYTPPAYSTPDATNHDLLVVFDGDEYLSAIPLPHILDSLLAAKRIPPMVAVFVADSSGAARLDDLANHERFVTFICDELAPWVRGRWKVTHDPRRTFVTGSSAGGLAAAFLALRRPDVFGNVLSQSGAFWRGAEGSNGAPFEWLTSSYASSPKRDVRFFLDVGSTETRGALNGTAPSILEANRHLRDVLRTKGCEVSYTEVPGGFHAPESWSGRLPVGLVTLAGSPAAKP